MGIFAECDVEGVAASEPAFVAMDEKVADIGVTRGIDARVRPDFTEERGVSLREISLERCSAIKRVCRAVVGVVEVE